MSLDDPPTINGHPAEIPFGDLPNQVLSLDWAEGMLRELFTTDRARFGRILSTVVTGDRPAKPGRPANKGAES